MRFLLLTLFLFCLPILGHAQDFYFLDIREIPGEATDANYRDQICITSFSWNVAVGTTSGGGGGGGVAIQEDFLMGKSLDIATVEIYEAVTRGKLFKDATLTLLRTNNFGVNVKVAEYEFSNLKFLSLQPGGAADGTINEVISLTAEEVKISQFDQNGALTGEFAWSFLTNSIAN